MKRFISILILFLLLINLVPAVHAAQRGTNHAQEITPTPIETVTPTLMETVTPTPDINPTFDNHITYGEFVQSLLLGGILCVLSLMAILFLVLNTMLRKK